MMSAHRRADRRPGASHHAEESDCFFGGVHHPRPVDRRLIAARDRSRAGAIEVEIVAPHDGVVIGLTTMPLVNPGDAVCHLAW
jgi:hypothetical protein